ncbi:MAG: FixH family protein [Campylobacteraceae bacterium]|nr:FixH family protein [Campylobacteraceae bacterium]
MEEKNNKKSFWPYGIIISIALVAIACIINVKIALDNPVEYDTYFLSNKQVLDEDINDLLASQLMFNEKYTVEVIYDKFKEKNNEVKIKIINKKTQEVIENANLELLITRPDVSTFDIRPKFIGLIDQEYVFEPFNVNKKGRWQILFTASIGKLSSFIKLETYAVIK